MKKTYLFLFIIVVITSITVFSCSKFGTENDENIKPLKEEDSIETRSSNVTYTVSDPVSNFNLTISFYDNGTHSMSATQEIEVATYLKHRFSSLNLISVSQVDAAFSYDPTDINKEKVTLHGFGMDNDENARPIAFVFNGDNDGDGGTLSLGTNSSGTEHSCTGAPCPCCDFIYREYTSGLFDNRKNKKIIGCKCETSKAECAVNNGKCNHTKTSKS